ncbi:UNVERIFIED_CONTAM: hypothetical protein GTU68_016620 [Idotea baltica]|nr:hypothetical protein [Idotea baltica]
MAAAQTGTGKTAGFTLPILHRLSNTPKPKGNGNQARALILTPTRELAAQVAASVETYGQNLKIKSVVVFGGVKINPQMQKLRGGTDVLIATPGRLLDLQNQNAIQLAIHGNKSQGARTKALAQFKDGKCRVLVATDIAARGIDIDQLPHVVNFDLPNVPEDYVHRIGRTGRAGASGEAVSLVSHDEAIMLRDIERLIKMKVPREQLDGYEPLNSLPESLDNVRPAKANKPKQQHKRSNNRRPKQGGAKHTNNSEGQSKSGSGNQKASNKKRPNSRRRKSNNKPGNKPPAKIG